ncbi:MAG: hypothetical protein ACLRMZ_13485 [Blautia marasmi]
MEDRIKEVLVRTPFWEHLTKEQQERVCRDSRVVQYPAGSLIYSPTRECLGTVFILKGSSVRTFCRMRERSDHIPDSGRGYLCADSLLCPLCHHF